MALRWKILALLVVARLGLGFQFQTLGSVSEQLVTEFGIDYTTVGTLIGVFMLAGLFLAVPAGWIGRYCSDRSLAALGLALLAAGGFVAAFADTTTQIGIGRVICGAGFVFSTVYFAKMTTDWFAGHEIATALGLLVMTWPLGIAAGQIVHTWIAESWHWSAAFSLASAFCAIGAVAVFIAYKPPPKTQGGTGLSQTGAGAENSTNTATGLSRKEVLLIVVASLSWALFNAGYVVYLSFATSWLTENGYTTLRAASTISVASWVMMLSGLVCGIVADRTGKPSIILYLCMGAAVITLLSLYATGTALVSSLMFGLIGAAPAGIIMALTSEAIEPQNRALGMGLFFTLYFLLVAPAPVVAGWLVDNSGSAWFAIVFAATLFAATAASYAAFRHTQRVLARNSY